jgi:non-ribosomal peptide synthetase component E (peptide arylation enzyme)
MTSYLNNKAATDEALDSEDWFHTGDVGKIDSHGHLWITDRLKDVMKVKGYVVAGFPSSLFRLTNLPVFKCRLLNWKTSFAAALQ